MFGIDNDIDKYLQNMIGHKNTVLVKSVEITWAAPNTSVGDIEVE